MKNSPATVKMINGITNPQGRR